MCENTRRPAASVSSWESHRPFRVSAPAQPLPRGQSQHWSTSARAPNSTGELSAWLCPGTLTHNLQESAPLWPPYLLFTNGNLKCNPAQNLPGAPASLGVKPGIGTVASGCSPYCLCLHLPPLSLLTLLRHSGLLSVGGALQDGSCPRAFARAVFAAWNVLICPWPTHHIL